ncbi:iron ABC transporter substrate-binding protein [Rhizobium sp. P40RR-XXII]|uniref:iron ABC transporter substrate-binding protein n=1 Tax=unclassified Rhizobium TaxID=2613769 RepID=UPI001456416A|nr:MULTISPECIES: iron ABC transporter substrate-binding protein [unclassified Rhizobium]NLR87680.1 iron ABC transporter substrate-binding protein [Rhizobium sp. P28RR-XV]NLS18340.1 iron ABC transporter substrate-binding protein [Rhizobium sp. P40RR-XXII]
MMKFFAVLALAFVGLLPAVAEARVITDAAGRTVSVPDKINRILVAGPPATVLVYVLAPEKLVGWAHAPDDAAKAYLMPSVRSLPSVGRLTGKDGTISAQAVMDAKPDIILDAGTVDPTYKALADKVQSATGIPYILIDGSFARTADTLRDVGALIGVEDRANKLADYADSAIKDLNEKLATLPNDPRPRVYYGRGADGLETGLSGSINLEILDAVGTMNVAAAAGKGGLAKVTVQQVVGWNPDIIIAETPAFAASVRSDPQWAGIKAVKDGKIFVPPSLPFGWFDSPPGVNRLFGVRWMEKLLYPKLFRSNFSDDVKQFYKLFYQVDLTDDQLAALLKGMK